MSRPCDYHPLDPTCICKADEGEKYMIPAGTYSNIPSTSYLCCKDNKVGYCQPPATPVFQPQPQPKGKLCDQHPLDPTCVCKADQGEKYYIPAGAYSNMPSASYLCCKNNKVGYCRPPAAPVSSLLPLQPPPEEEDHPQPEEETKPKDVIPLPPAEDIIPPPTDKRKWIFAAILIVIVLLLLILMIIIGVKYL